MKFCSSCGMQLADDVKFCVKCGAAQPPVPQAAPVQPPVNYAQPPVNYTQPPVQYTQPPMNYTQPPVQPGYIPAAPMSPLQAASQTYGMGWFKFLIYFALFAGAILNIAQGAMMLSGEQYDGVAELVYAMFDGLQGLDMGVGIALIALAILQLVTRFRLAGFRRGADKLIVTCYVSIAVIEMVYVIGFLAIMPEHIVEDMDLSSSISSTVLAVAMTVVNSAYFNKRKALFVN